MFDWEFEAAYRTAADRLESQFAAVFGSTQAAEPRGARPRDTSAQPIRHPQDEVRQLSNRLPHLGGLAPFT